MTDRSNQQTKAERVAVLFQEQGGLCSICGYPMLPFSTAQGFPRYAATLDHLVEKGTTSGASRPVKAAHRVCNNARGHDDRVAEKHLEKMRKNFDNAGWVNMLFKSAEGASEGNANG